MKKAKTRNFETQRTVDPMSSQTKTMATQTADFDNLMEIAKLQEQVKLLQLENDILRQHVETSNKLDNVKHCRSFHLTAQLTSKINVGTSSCACKGNCSSRCGCVKKSNKCNPLCKCNDKLCQNQMQNLKDNHENKENIDKNYIETFKDQSTKKNKVTKIAEVNKDLSSSDTEDLYKDLHEKEKGDACKHLQKRQINYIQPSFANVEDMMQNLETDSNSNTNQVVALEKERKEKDDNVKEQLRSLEKTIFDPMKPRHQLSRTPPNNKKCIDEELKINETIRIQLCYEPTQEVAIISSNIRDTKEDKVDWEQHTAQLIPCKKCKRTFMPHRIQKHEACCKKI